MIDLYTYTNLLLSAGCITPDQEETILNMIKGIEDHKERRMKKLDDDFWQEEGL